MLSQALNVACVKRALVVTGCSAGTPRPLAALSGRHAPRYTPQMAPECTHVVAVMRCAAPARCTGAIEVGQHDRAHAGHGRDSAVTQGWCEGGFSCKPTSTPVERLWNTFGDNLTPKRRSMKNSMLVTLFHAAAIMA